MTHRLLPTAWITASTLIAGIFTSHAEVSFNFEVRPILSKNCIGCHGPDPEERGGDYRLDNYEGAIRTKDGVSGIIPGDPANSDVYKRIISDDKDYRMPEASHGDKLKPEQIATIKQWISEGAKYETHWAFVLPTRPAPPQSKFSDRARTPIDQFTFAKLEEKDLAPSPEATPYELLRRTSLDLIGLPPSLEMVEAFTADPSDEHFAKLVDQILDNPAYGEHWAAKWLDFARYADTIGYAEDKYRPIWPWRDWVIRAFNNNKSYRDFTIEQLAGDLLPSPTDDQILATAFHRNTPSNSEGGTNDEEFRTIAVKDRSSVTFNSWMGLTLRCAECHTHKYDPISQKEYYQFLDFFNQTADSDKNDEKPLKEFTVLDNQKVKVPIIKELPKKKHRKTHINLRGNFMSLGEKVTATVPASFHPFPADAPQNRLGVAQWIMDDKNPLTGRVAANRLWAQLFGIGIVETEEDFGIQGTLPTHPLLLDWLAVEYRENGWNQKALLKLLVTSSIYRQSAKASPTNLEKDPRNQWLSRGPRFRLSAETVRDQALYVSGLLSRKRFGPPVYPPNPIKKYVNAFTGGMEWKVSKGEDRYRRALYTYLKRSSPHPLFETFDMATREVCNLRRFRTNTPLQSFQTLNDEAFIEASQALARLMLKHSGDIDQKISYGLRRTLLRPVDPRQLEIFKQLYTETLDDYKDQPEAAKTMAGTLPLDGISPNPQYDQVAAMTVVANIMLNLDGFLTK